MLPFAALMAAKVGAGLLNRPKFTPPAPHPTAPPGLLDPQAQVDRVRQAALGAGGGSDPIAITPQMQRTQAPPPMQLRGLLDPEPEKKGLSPEMRRAIMMSGLNMMQNPNGGFGGMVNAAAPVLEQLLAKRQAEGKPGFLTSLLGR